MRKQAGFSMLETMIATFLFALVFIALTTVFSSNRAVYDRGQRNIELQQTARVAVRMLTRELRLAGFDPQGAIAAQKPATAIQSADTDTISFIADLDSDDLVERVTYRMSGSELIQEVADWNGSTFGAPRSSTMASGVAQLSFAYFDELDQPITAPVSASGLANITRVAVGLTTIEVGHGSDTSSFSLTMDVRIRNQ